MSKAKRKWDTTQSSEIPISFSFSDWMAPVELTKFMWPKVFLNLRSKLETDEAYAFSTRSEEPLIESFS